MSSINICLSLKSSRLDPLQNEVFDKDYKDVYKPALKFLYSHPAFRFSFCFNGVQLSFLQKKYPEYLRREGILYGYQDGVHPTKEGYLALADIFCEAYADICKMM